MDRRGVLARMVGAVAALVAAPLARLGAITPRPSSLLEYDEHGIPYIATTRAGRYHWYHPKVRLTLDGKMPGACRGWNRREGYVECAPVVGDRWWRDEVDGFPKIDHEHAHETVRRYGDVRVFWDRS